MSSKDSNYTYLRPQPYETQTNNGTPKSMGFAESKHNTQPAHRPWTVDHRHINTDYTLQTMDHRLI